MDNLSEQEKKSVIRNVAISVVVLLAFIIFSVIVFF